MSEISDLIRRLCPSGVAFKTLGDVGTFIRGGGLQKSDLTDSGFPALHYGQIHTHYGTWARETKSFVPHELAGRLRKAVPGDLIITTTSEDDEAVGKAVAWLGNDEVAVSGDAYIYRHTLAPKFVSYFFQSNQFRAQKRRHITGTKVRRISGESLAKILIPVPPRAVQEKLVDLLDRFEMTNALLAQELDAEVLARKSQHRHIRSMLLTLPADSVDHVALGEAGIIFGGLTGKSKRDFSNGNARYVTYMNVYNNAAVDTMRDDYVQVGSGEKQHSLQRGDVLFTGSSETADDVAMASVITQHVSEPLYLNSFCIGFRPHDSTVLDPDFSKHLFRSEAVRQQLVRTANGVTRFNVSKALLAKVELPIPGIDEQRQLAAVLDRLDTLMAGLSSSLVQERLARRAQYVHYREHLLTYPETGRE